MQFVDMKARKFGRFSAALLFAGACSSAPTPTTVGSAPSGASAKGMVVSASSIASQAGRDVLAAGGNAVDAAIATGFALSVTYPVAGNIGGGGFMIIRMPDGRATAIDFREMAPRAATPEMFTDANGAYSSTIHHDSHKSVGVPGTVAGFALAHKKYGKSEWTRLVDPAVRLASDGFVVPTGLAQSLKWGMDDMKKYPASVASFTKSGAPYEVGDRIRQPDLARTLRPHSLPGSGRFLSWARPRDSLAEEDASQWWIDHGRRHGAATVAKERTPIRGTYRGYRGDLGCHRRAPVVWRWWRCSTSSRGTNSAVGKHNSPQVRAPRGRGDASRVPGSCALPRRPGLYLATIERLTSKAYAAELRKTILRTIARARQRRRRWRRRTRARRRPLLRRRCERDGGFA